MRSTGRKGMAGEEATAKAAGRGGAATPASVSFADDSMSNKSSRNRRRAYCRAVNARAGVVAAFRYAQRNPGEWIKSNLGFLQKMHGFDSPQMWSPGVKIEMREAEKETASPGQPTEVRMTRRTLSSLRPEDIPPLAEEHIRQIQDDIRRQRDVRLFSQQ